MIQFDKTQPNTEHPQVTDVTPQEVWEKREQLALIDVRREEEYLGDLGHVAGSKLITLDFLPSRLSEVPKDKPVVFICRSGGRSGRAAYFARENGYTTVYNMQGGMLLWNEVMLPVERA